MARTFPVSDVELAWNKCKVLDREATLTQLLHQPVEALYTSTRDLVIASDAHPLAAAAREAFYEHRPLVLSPDVIWFCLAQGLAHHINLNAERLRHRFVRHEGKKKLVVVRPDFLLGQPNPWHEVFATFSAQIAENVGKLRDLVVADFSTTGPVERAASEIVLMDAFQAYFEYEMHIGCGIPSITLTGTIADWKSVRQRAAMLAELDLEHWARVLLPVLDEVVATAEGEDRRTFWQSFFHYESGSGGQELTGWIHVLFPYLSDLKGGLVPNPHLDTWRGDFETVRARADEWQLQGPSIEQLPSGLASAPVLASDSSGHETTLRFIAGLFGVTQDRETGALEPEMGWAIVYGDETGTRAGARDYDDYDAPDDAPPREWIDTSDEEDTLTESDGESAVTDDLERVDDEA